MSAIPRNSYHTAFKNLIQLGLAPQEVVKDLPKATVHRFRNSDYSRLKGSEYVDLLEKLDLLKEIAASKVALRTAQAILRIARFIKDLGIPVEKIKSTRIPQVRSLVVAFVKRLESLLPRQRILRFLGLTSAKFASWSKGTIACLSSPWNLCRTKYPHQLSLKEISRIRRAFLNPNHQAWPASAVAWDLIHRGMVAAHVRTITDYAKALGLRTAAIPKKSRKRGSLSTNKPNQAWHLDATVLRTQDNRRAYVQLVMDNFSRKIISWQAAPAISGLRTAALLTRTFASLPKPLSQDLSLIVDGGPENNNTFVTTSLQPFQVRKLIAQVDVSFSNSLIEAFNKILKYHYLFRHQIRDLDHLEEEIAQAVTDYNNRPHSALQGLTPSQVYDGKTFDLQGYKSKLSQARFLRLADNRASCPPCTPLAQSFGEEQPQS